MGTIESLSGLMIKVAKTIGLDGRPGRQTTDAAASEEAATAGKCSAVVRELGVSRPTMYRLIVAYRAEGTRYKKAPISAALPYRTCVPPDETRRRSNQAA
jgi:hypothetical protein